MNKWICITGTDGCGKSSLLNELQRMNYEIVSHDRKHLPEQYYYINDLIKNTDQNYLVEQGTAEEMLSLFKKISLVKATIAVEKKRLASRNVFVNDYYYKWAARELVRGKVSMESIKQYFEDMPKPDLVVILKRDIDSIAKTKYKLNRMEYLNTENDFISFQANVYETLFTLIDVPYIVIENNSSIKSLVNSVLRAV